MVGIVIVSHSRQLAEGVRELAEQMVQGLVPLAVAGGIDDPQNPLGTDALQVHQAIASVYSDDGVVVLMDLGSALLSAEMALEFLPEEQRDKVRLLDAPLVEGALAAAVEAAAGSDIEQVMAEARGALAAKAAQLQLELTCASPAAPEAQTLPVKEIRLTIRNRLGLHARPAAQFVATAARFPSQIRVRNLTRGTEFVSAQSINQLATLGVRQGHELVITAQGSDANEALAALQALVEANFGEVDTALESPPSAQTKATPQTKGEILGIPASPGIAIGPVFLYNPNLIKVQEHCVDDVETEWQRLQTAIQTARQEIQALRRQTATQIGDSEAAIFDVHLLFLEDPALLDAVRAHIFEQRLNAEVAWATVVNELVTAYRALEDSYMQERAG